MASGDLSYFHLSPPTFVPENQAALRVSIVPVTAPRPLFRFEHQSALHRIAVHITQLLNALLLAEDDKIVEAALPDVTGLERSVPQLALPRVGPQAKLAQPAPRKTLFQSLHYDRRIATLRFAEEQMHVLGHDHVTGNDKTIA